MAGVLLSSMHQSFLGGLFLISPGKLYPLWYTHNIHGRSVLPVGDCGRACDDDRRALPEHAFAWCTD